MQYQNLKYCYNTFASWLVQFVVLFLIACFIRVSYIIFHSTINQDLVVVGGGVVPHHKKMLTS